jgi:hypothetical protein
MFGNQVSLPGIGYFETKADFLSVKLVNLDTVIDVKPLYEHLMFEQFKCRPHKLFRYIVNGDFHIPVVYPINNAVYYGPSIEDCVKILKRKKIDPTELLSINPELRLLFPSAICYAQANPTPNYKVWYEKRPMNS